MSGYCGFLNVLKPPGMSSAQVVGYARRLLDGEKLGHAGTLDPEAAGVLPLMAGKAARLFDYMQDKQKAYIAEVAFGAATDTQDAQGTVTETGDNYPDEAAIRAALPRFIGEGLQRPPMYSALKRDGQRLYDLARKGQTVELEPRPVTVYSLALIALTERHGALISVRCAKGFYVRTLCDDLGRALGCPAHMRFLLRTQSGVFTLDRARTLEELAEAKRLGALAEMLTPPETALAHLPAADVPPRWEKPFRNGVALPASLFPQAPGEGALLRMRLNGALAAVCELQNGQLRLKTWLAE